MDMRQPAEEGITRNGHNFIRLGSSGFPLCVIDELNVRPGPVEGLTLQGMLQVYELFLQRYQLIYLFRNGEQRGTEEQMGTEEQRGTELTIREEAESYMNALFDFSHPSVHLFGISYGGLIAMEIAASAPQLLRSLTVALVGCRVAPPMARELRRLADLVRRGEWRQFHAGMAGALHHHSSLRPLFVSIAWMLPKLLGVPEDPERVALMLEAFAEANLCERVSRIEVPTLLVAGDQDPYLNRDILDRTVAALPQGELALYEGAGHSLLRSRQDEVDGRILSFLESTEA
ncbi:MAG: alpha/beta fold hydrolase [Spirochaetaceae bacterium]